MRRHSICSWLPSWHSMLASFGQSRVFDRTVYHFTFSGAGWQMELYFVCFLRSPLLCYLVKDVRLRPSLSSFVLRCPPLSSVVLRCPPCFPFFPSSSFVLFCLSLPSLVLFRPPASGTCEGNGPTATNPKRPSTTTASYVHSTDA